MSTAYDNWISSQEEPDLKIDRGNHKRYPPIPTIQQLKSNDRQDWIDEYGLEDWNRRLDELREWEDRQRSQEDN